MNLPLSKRWAEHWEGRRAFAYDDKTGKRIACGARIVGKPTIAVGLNLATTAAHILISGLGLDFTGVSTGEIPLSDPQIDKILSLTLATAISDARRLFAGFDSFPDNAQLVITDLAFNMGAPALATFTHACSAIHAKNWTAAAAALRDSAWFHQVGPELHQRGGADAAVLSGTANPEDILS